MKAYSEKSAAGKVRNVVKGTLGAHNHACKQRVRSRPRP